MKRSVQCIWVWYSNRWRWMIIIGDSLSAGRRHGSADQLQSHVRTLWRHPCSLLLVVTLWRLLSVSFLCVGSFASWWTSSLLSALCEVTMATALSDQVFVCQVLTKDLGGNSKCSEFTAEICHRIQDMAWSCRDGAAVGALRLRPPGPPPAYSHASPSPRWLVWSVQGNRQLQFYFYCSYIKQKSDFALTTLWMWRGRGFCSSYMSS